MVLSVKPSIVENIKYSLPEHIRVRNPLLVKFVEFYYQWMEKEGQPLAFLNYVLDLKDVDSTTNIFNRKIFDQMLALLPQNSKVDKSLVLKNLDHFLKSKGSMESFQFVMKALFDQEMELEYQHPYVMAASANQLDKDSLLVLKSTDDFSQSTGSFLQQPDNFSSALIETATEFTLNSEMYWELRLSSIVGEFTPYATVQSLKKTINRNFIVVDQYFTLVNLFPVLDTEGMIHHYQLQLKSTSPLMTADLNGMYVRQLNTGFAGVLDQPDPSIKFSYTDGLYYYYSFSLSSWSNAASITLTDDIFFVAPEIVNKIITKSDYVYGEVKPMVAGFEYNNRGSLYEESLPVRIQANNELIGNAAIEFLNEGPVEEIEIIKGGFGYHVGYPILSATIDSSPFVASIGAIDGYGAKTEIVMEIDQLFLESGGHGYTINDKLYPVGIPDVELQVGTVALDSTITSVQISGSNRGSFKVCPKFSSIATTSATGTGCVVSFSYRVKSIKLLDGGRHYRSAVISHDGCHGMGASFQPEFVSGAVSTFTISNAGSGYTYASAWIDNSVGKHAQLTPLLNNAGQITGFTIVDPGYNYTHGDVITIVGNGTNAAATVNTVKNMCVRNVRVLNGGSAYNKNTTLTYTNTTGGGGTSCSLTPQIDDSGSIVKVIVNSQGNGYSDNSDSIVVGGFTDASLNVTLSPENGAILDYNITDGGSGYKTQAEEPPTYFTITTVAGYGAVLTPVIGAGRLIHVNILNCGYGYAFGDTITVHGAGVNATCTPRIGPKGEIIAVDITNNGNGYYQGTTVSIYGDGMTAAVVPIIETGIVSVDVLNIPYRTWYLVQEDETNILDEAGDWLCFDLGVSLDPVSALLTENYDRLDCEDNDILVYSINPGSRGYWQVTDLVQEDGSRLYTEDYYDLVSDRPVVTITVSDPTGTGAILVPVIDEETGVMVSVTVVNKGTGYTNPSYVIYPDFGLYSAVLKLNVPRYISGLTWTSHGTDYGTAKALVQSGSGQGAHIEFVTDISGAITNIALTGQGSGFTSTPELVITDNSGYGAVSKIDITDGGSYTRVPHVLLARKTHGTTTIVVDADGAQLVARSNTIGTIKTVKLIDISYSGHDAPSIIFPLVVGVDYTGLILGERVYTKFKSYHSQIDLMQEDGFKILAPYSDHIEGILTEMNEELITDDEDELDLVYLQYDDNQLVNFYGTVVDIDYPRQLVYIEFDDDIGTDFFDMVTEDGQSIKEETGYDLVYEHSAKIQLGDTLIGEQSGLSTVITYLNRASANPIMAGVVDLNRRFDSNAGKLSHPLIKVHNGKKVQNFAYIIRTGISKSTYEMVLKSTVHPAGYAMYGDVLINMDSTQDHPYGLRPSQDSKFATSFMELIITMLMGLAYSPYTNDRQRLGWLEEHKFAIESCASYVYNLTTDASLDWLNTEDGDRIVSKEEYSCSGDSIESYMNFLINSVNTTARGYTHLSKVKMPFETDSSCYITLINNR